MINYSYQENLEHYLSEKIAQYHDFKKQTIDPYILSIKDKKFLEIGYGAGSVVGGIFMALFYKDGASRPVYGIDVVHPSFNMSNQRTRDFWKLAKEKYKIIQDSEPHYWNEHDPILVKLHMNSEKMYLKNDLVDVIYSSAVLEHIKNPNLAFKEMYRILTPGGLSIHCWNPYTSLTMGAHDIGIPFYYPWPHLRLSEKEHIEKLNEVFSNKTLRHTASVPEHTLTDEFLDGLPNYECIYYGAKDDLNKISVSNMIKYAQEAGFKVINKYFQYYTNINSEDFLTIEIQKELNGYTKEELMCSSHWLILYKEK